MAMFNSFFYVYQAGYMLYNSQKDHPLAPLDHPQSLHRQALKAPVRPMNSRNASPARSLTPLSRAASSDKAPTCRVRRCSSGKKLGYTLWQSNITMENGHVEWENSLFLWPFSIVMLVYQRVYPLAIQHGLLENPRTKMLVAGKVIQLNGGFSIATFDCRRVYTL